MTNAIYPAAGAPITLSPEVAFERLVLDVTNDLIIRALEEVVVGQRSIEGLRDLAQEYADPREKDGRNFRMTTAIRRENGLREEARERAGDRLGLIAAKAGVGADGC
jgi:hypothetical protein